MLLFDILQLLSDDKKDDGVVQAELYAFIPNNQAIKYLVTFRAEICAYLKASNFFGK